MPFTTGTVTNHNGLLDALNTWLQGLTSPWVELAYTPANEEVTIAAINTIGANYLVNDVLTISGGTFSTAAQLTVTAIDGSGGITGISITTAGIYSVTPSNPASHTGGAGTGADFTLTWTFIATDVASLSLEGPGNGASARVYVNIETQAQVGPGYYTWDLYGATGWASGLDHGLQQGAGGPSFFNMWQNTIDYWFYANDRRFIIKAQVSTNIMDMYAGFLLPPALPTEYPFPMYICGSYPEPQVASVPNARNSMIVDPGADGAAWYRRRTTEIWSKVENQANSSSAVAPKTGQRAFVWPHKTGRNSQSGSNNADNWSGAGFNVMRLNANGESPLVLAHVIDMNDGTIVGALEGCYSVSGFGRTTGQVINIAGQDYRLFQRAFRNQPGDFMAIEEL